MSESLDLAAEAEAIRVENERWLHAFQTHDAAGEAAVFASDGVEYRAGLQPIVGPIAIEEFDTRFFSDNPNLTVSWRTDQIQVAASGDLAVQTGDFKASGVGPAADEEDWGRILTVWKKEAGRWRVAHAMVSSTKPYS